MKKTITPVFQGASKVDNRQHLHDLRSLCILAGAFCLLLSGPVFSQPKADVTALNDRAIELSRNGMLGKAIEIWVELLEVTEAEYAYRWVFHKKLLRRLWKM